jgi:hypothetical protein
MVQTQYPRLLTPAIAEFLKSALLESAGGKRVGG